jgi:hypothetical protein
MTPQQIDAMKLALEALEGFYEYGYDRQECFEHITAIKEALAEHAMREVQRLGQEIEQKIGCVNHDCDQCKAQRTEQEPVQYKCTVIDNQHPNGIPLEQWVKPPQRTWVGLTGEELHEACWESYVDPVTGECSTGDREYAVRWTEAKLKEKNT